VVILFCQILYFIPLAIYYVLVTIGVTIIIVTVLKFVKLVTRANVLTLVKFENKVTRKSEVILVTTVTIAPIGTLVTLVTGGHGKVSDQSRRKFMQIFVLNVRNFYPYFNQFLMWQQISKSH
jgi:hypothetical protein